MDFYPIFLSVSDHRVLVSGGGEAAVSKLRLLLKTSARIEVFAEQADDAIRNWAQDGRVTLITRSIQPADLAGAKLLYAAHDDDALDRAVVRMGRAAGVLTNWVDNLDNSDFLTPAIVDRDPVTVAIGTEGTAPVLARRIKADLETRLPARLGRMARAAAAFRPVAERLTSGRVRRAFWAEFFAGKAETANDSDVLQTLFTKYEGRTNAGRVDLVGAGPGDPELLTLKARNVIHDADVVIHDQLVPQPILELARREALVIETGKKGFGPSVTQDAINALMVEHARRGAHVVRLKSGDPTVFGRLDEELEALQAAGIPFAVQPGITAASAAVAAIGQSFTKRGRNSAARIVTGHDINGFAEQDWKSLARPGEVAAIYMGKRSARFLQGRLLMHGASPETPVTVIENASRPDERVIETSLQGLPAAVEGVDGPAVLMLGLAPRRAALPQTETQPKELAQ